MRRLYRLVADGVVCGACTAVMLGGGWVLMLMLLWHDDLDPLDAHDRYSAPR